MEKYKELIIAATLEKDWEKVRQMVPELVPLFSIGQGTHVIQVVNNLLKDGSPLTESLVLLAILHDVGKEATKKTHGEGFWSFHGHDSVGSEMVPYILARLEAPGWLQLEVAALVALHMWPMNTSPEEVSDKAIRRLIRRIGDRNVGMLFQHAEADLKAMDPSHRRDMELERLPRLRARVQEVEDVANPRD